jgi:hypothetical protein
MSEHNVLLAKVLFSSEDGKVETLWTVPLGDNLYCLNNSPWLIYGLSWQDVIEAEAKDKDGLPIFRQVIKKSGNRTLRLLLDPAANQSPKSQEILNKLIEMGCSYEGANQKFFAINVPPSIDLRQICDFLTGTGSQWEHADPIYEELYPTHKSQ